MGKTSVEEVSLYKISNLYSDYDKRDSLYIRINMNIQELLEVIVALQCEFQKVVSTQHELPEEQLVELLETFYGASNVTEEYKDQHYKFYLNKKHWDVTNRLSFKGEGQSRVNREFLIQIDICKVRDSYCDSECIAFTEKHLPKSEAFNSALLELKYCHE